MSACYRLRETKLAIKKIIFEIQWKQLKILISFCLTKLASVLSGTILIIFITTFLSPVNKRFQIANCFCAVIPTYIISLIKTYFLIFKLIFNVKMI